MDYFEEYYDWIENMIEFLQKEFILQQSQLQLHWSIIHQKEIVFITSYELKSVEFTEELVEISDDISIDHAISNEPNKIHESIGKTVFWFVADNSGIISIWKTISIC